MTTPSAEARAVLYDFTHIDGYGALVIDLDKAAALMHAYAAAKVEEERERCARVADVEREAWTDGAKVDEEAGRSTAYATMRATAAQHIAAAIRQI